MVRHPVWYYVVAVLAAFVTFVAGPFVHPALWLLTLAILAAMVPVHLRARKLYPTPEASQPIRIPTAALQPSATPIALPVTPALPETVRTRVVGTSYYDGLDRLTPGHVPAALRREPDNAHDPNAIAVWTGVPLCMTGHIPADVAARHARAMDASSTPTVTVEARLTDHDELFVDLPVLPEDPVTPVSPEPASHPDPTEGPEISSSDVASISTTPTLPTAPDADLSRVVPPVSTMVPVDRPPVVRQSRRAARREAKERQRAFAQWKTQQDAYDLGEEVARRLATHEGIDSRVMLKSTEVAVWTGEAGLVSPKRNPGHYVGGSSGVSFKVAKGVNFRVGATRGTYIQGDEVQAVTDHGTVTITNSRVIFQGATTTREWAYNKFIGMDNTEDGGTVLIHVSNRQKVSGIKTSTPDFALALAICLDALEATSSEVLQRVSTAAEEHRRLQPTV